MIPLSRQSISSVDISKVSRVLKSDLISRGKEILKFEKAVCKKVRCRYGVSVNSASSALLLSYIALGIQKNDYVWSVPNTFVSTVSSCLHLGVKVDFVDIDPIEYNISTIKLENKLKITPKNKLPKVLSIVHLAGFPCDQKKIVKLGKKYGFKILEDASHALGAINDGEPVGSCKWSDLCIFSFHPSKSITTGEGGMILTNNNKTYYNLLKLRNNGIEKKKLIYKKNFGPWYYEVQTQGFNFWMTDFQAALGNSQLKRLDLFIKKRNKIARNYDKYLKNFKIGLPYRKKKIISSFHLYIINLKNKFNYKKIFHGLLKKKIQINLHYIPVHIHPIFRKMGFKKGQFPESENYAKNCISLPIYPDLNASKQIKVIKTLKKLIKKNK